MTTKAKAKRQQAQPRGPSVAKRFLTRADAAEFLSVSMATLSRWAAERIGPPFVKFGDSEKAGVRYPLDGLEEFVESRMKRPK